GRRNRIDPAVLEHEVGDLDAVGQSQPTPRQQGQQLLGPGGKRLGLVVADLAHRHGAAAAGVDELAVVGLALLLNGGRGRYTRAAGCGSPRECPVSAETEEELQKRPGKAARAGTHELAVSPCPVFSAEERTRTSTP